MVTEGMRGDGSPNQSPHNVAGQSQPAGMTAQYPFSQRIGLPMSMTPQHTGP
jgi:hypothetical protein